MSHRITKIALVLTLTLTAFSGCTGTPTVPLPPPNALVSSPSPDGVVTIQGSAALPGAILIAYNENTGDGTLTTADSAGEFTLMLRASIGDSLLVWQRAGAESGEQLNLIVRDSAP